MPSISNWSDFASKALQTIEEKKNPIDAGVDFKNIESTCGAYHNSGMTFWQHKPCVQCTLQCSLNLWLRLHCITCIQFNKFMVLNYFPGYILDETSTSKQMHAIQLNTKNIEFLDDGSECTNLLWLATIAKSDSRQKQCNVLTTIKSLKYCIDRKPNIDNSPMREKNRYISPQVTSTYLNLNGTAISINLKIPCEKIIFFGFVFFLAIFMICESFQIDFVAYQRGRHFQSQYLCAETKWHEYRPSSISTLGSFHPCINGHNGRPRLFSTIFIINW